MFSLRGVEYSQKNERVKQNKLKLHFGFWVFSCLVAEAADKYSLEMVLKEKMAYRYIFLSSFTPRASNSKDDNFLLLEMQSVPLFLHSPGFIALLNYCKHCSTFATFTSGHFLSPTRAWITANHSKTLDILLTVGLKNNPLSTEIDIKYLIRPIALPGTFQPRV